jgi:hypothetical protein
MTDAPLPLDLAREVRQTLKDLRQARLAATAWPVVAGDLGRLASAVEHRDDELVRKALVPISQATFEGKVRGRLAGANRAAGYVAATKQTSALPAVGLVSAALLMIVGYLIGGSLVAAGTAVLSLFIFAVAYVGSRSNLERVERRQRETMAPTMERTEPAPSVVAEALTRIEAALRQPKPAAAPEADDEPEAR